MAALSNKFVVANLVPITTHGSFFRNLNNVQVDLIICQKLQLAYQLQNIRARKVQHFNWLDRKYLILL